MGAHEELEHAEHTAHSHGAKHMGITMAVLAVLIAFCAAMVGSQRQELMTAMLDQSWAHASWVAAVVKEEMVTTDLQKLRGQPNLAGNPALTRLIRMDSDYTTESGLAKDWDDVSDPLINAHYDAAEGYEHAQLVAEVALIVASVGILLNNRMAWLGSLGVGAVSLVLVLVTFVSARSEIARNHHKVEEAEEAYIDYSESDLDSKGREETLNELDPGGKIRASVASEAKHDEEEYKEKHKKGVAGKPEEHKADEHKSEEKKVDEKKADEKEE